MSTLKRTIWFCECCQAVDSVAMDEHEGDWCGAQKVLDSHQKTSPQCETDNPRILELRFIIEPHVPDWAVKKILDLLGM